MRDFYRIKTRKSRVIFMKDKLNVAIVLKPQGIRGEVKVKALCDSAEDLKGLKRVFIDGVEYGVLGVRAQGETGYISLKGIFDRNAAEHLRGKDIFALRDDMPPLPEDRCYIADWTGCAVVASSGEEIGEVVSVTPARTDIYTITTTKGEVSFAAAEGVIEEIDVQSKKITVNEKRFKEVSV